MDDSEGPRTPEREVEQETAHRQLAELLNELRVAIPSVQVLFAFLLSVPFQQRFASVSHFERDVYFGTLLSAAAASAALIAPAAIHRIEFRHHDIEHVIKVSNRLAIAGLVMLALAITGAVLMVTHFLFGAPTTVIVTTIVGSVIGMAWFVLPLLRRIKHSQRRSG